MKENELKWDNNMPGNNRLIFVVLSNREIVLEPAKVWAKSSSTLLSKRGYYEQGKYSNKIN